MLSFDEFLVKHSNSILLIGENVDTEQKYGAGQNKHTVTSMNTTKLANETEELKHDKVSMDVGRLIQKGRQAKGWSQKELATKICEKPQIINEYESSKAVPNQVILLTTTFIEQLTTWTKFYPIVLTLNQ
jgi:ribosome-binding protein aMBF1 (putative translation factor)